MVTYHTACGTYEMHISSNLCFMYDLLIDHYWFYYVIAVYLIVH